MTHKESNRGSNAGPWPLKLEWTPPQVNRLVAGGAEAGPNNDVEGADGLS